MTTVERQTVDLSACPELKDSPGTGFWHETYFIRGGMEAIYDDVHKRIGFAGFAPVVDEADLS